MSQRVAVIIGAGPAGLTAAYELLQRSDVHPVVLEMDDQLGGLARTVNHQGNRIDIGGHRFFSRSDRIMDWWQAMLPLQKCPGGAASGGDIAYQGARRPVAQSGDGPDPHEVDRVMLLRRRVSRIFFRRRFFRYPLSVSLETLRSLGWSLTGRIAGSYLRARLGPIRPERSLEDFFINRFGRELYRTFFKSYTEKVWGVPCERIPAEWGAQRVKGLNVWKAVKDALLRLLAPGSGPPRRPVETSLIEQFLYPKFGPGQMWEETARRVRELGGEIHLRHEVVGLACAGRRITTVRARNLDTGTEKELPADHVFSSMPLRTLIERLDADTPDEVADVAAGLEYRDFITVGLLLKRLRLEDRAEPGGGGRLIPDNWIYVQEPDVRVGRLQIFNNWSPFLVRDPDTVWMGLEYFANEGDDLWRRSDADMTALAVEELSRLGFIRPEDVLDQVVIRMPKAYPAYFGSYDRFHVLRSFLDRIDNLFLIGRNGMHRYNNQDHSMLTAMAAVENIIQGVTTKANIWEVNTESDYHEEGGRSR